MLAKVINIALICAKSFNFGSRTMSQTYNFPKRNAFSFNLFQRLTAIQHRLIKPSPRTCNRTDYQNIRVKLFIYPYLSITFLDNQNFPNQGYRLPFHFLPGSIDSAFKTIARVANPQYAGSDCV